VINFEEHTQCMESEKNKESTRTEVIDNLNVLYGQLGPVKPASEIETLVREMHKEVFHLQVNVEKSDNHVVLKNFEAFMDKELNGLIQSETLADSTEVKKKKLQFIRGTQFILSDYLR
jgi:hypothetical protein